MVQLESVNVFRRWNQKSVLPGLRSQVFCIQMDVVLRGLSQNGRKTTQDRRGYVFLSGGFGFFLNFSNDRMQRSVLLEESRGRHVGPDGFLVTFGRGQRTPSIRYHRRSSWQGLRVVKNFLIILFNGLKKFSHRHTYGFNIRAIDGNRDGAHPGYQTR